MGIPEQRMSEYVDEDFFRPSGFLFEAISIDLFVCLCVLAVEVITVHIGMIVCMVKYRLYRNRYQSLKDLKKFKDFVTKEIPIPAETMDQEMQTDETCFEDNGYLPIVGKTPDPVVITKELDSMPQLEGQESSIVLAEQPPNY